MNNLRFVTLLAIIFVESLNLYAQELEPVEIPIEILPSPTLIVYHMDQWVNNQIILNAVETGVGLYAVIIDEDGNIINQELWHNYSNTCYFLTESRFFRNSDGSLCFYYVKGPDHPMVYKVNIAEDFGLTTFEFPEAFPFPEEISHDDWWNFAWLPNEDGSLFVSGVYIDGTHCMQMLVRYNESGDCLVSTAGKDRNTGEFQHAIFRLSQGIFLGIDEAHVAGFAVAVAYPNPGGNTLNIRTALQNAHLEIYDLTGKLIHNQQITDAITSINAGNWCNGVYVWKVIANGKEAECGKWIKE